MHGWTLLRGVSEIISFLILHVHFKMHSPELFPQTFDNEISCFPYVTKKNCQNKHPVRYSVPLRHVNIECTVDLLIFVNKMAIEWPIVVHNNVHVKIDFFQIFIWT